MVNITPFILNPKNITKLKSSFIDKYGNYAAPYPAINELGEQKFNTAWPILAAIIISVFISVFMMQSAQRYDINGKRIEQPKYMSYMRKFAWFLVIVLAFDIGYAIYLFLFVYLQQYQSWLVSLPKDAQEAYHTITKKVNDLNDFTYNNQINLRVLNY